MPIASTILLAEECDATRVFLADNLAADGYRVLVAPDRAKAIALTPALACLLVWAVIADHRRGVHGERQRVDQLEADRVRRVVVLDPAVVRDRGQDPC